MLILIILSKWDIMSSGGTVQSIANLSKGQDRGNAVTIQVSCFGSNFSTWRNENVNCTQIKVWC